MSLNKTNGLTRREFLSMVTVAGLSVPFVGANRLSASAVVNPPSDSKRPVHVFSKHLQWLDYQGMADTAAEIGFDGVDLTVRPGGHVLPENAERDLPKAVKAIRNAGMEIHMMTTAITDPDDEHTEPILKTASELGIKLYRTGYLSYRDDMGIAESLESHRSRWRKLMKLNRKYGLNGNYQNHAGTRVGGPVWDLWMLSKGLDPEYIGVQYDVRHATVEGGNSWILGMELVRDYIGTTVIKDFVWEKDESRDGWYVRNVPVGAGMVDWEKYWETIQKYDISGPISVHYEYDFGGAEHGTEEISISREEIISKMKRDLEVIRNWLSEYNLA